MNVTCAVNKTRKVIYHCKHFTNKPGTFLVIFVSRALALVTAPDYSYGQDIIMVVAAANVTNFKKKLNNIHSRCQKKVVYLIFRFLMAIHYTVASFLTSVRKSLTMTVGFKKKSK